MWSTTVIVSTDQNNEMGFTLCVMFNENVPGYLHTPLQTYRPPYRLTDPFIYLQTPL